MTLLERATALHRAGKLEEARRLYLEITRSAPQVAEAWHRLGLIAQAMGRLDDAAELMRKALQLDQGQPHYFYALGLVLQDQNNIAAAEQAYRQALAGNPQLAPVHHQLGLLYESQRHYDAAIQCFREAVRCNPGYARAHNNLGSLLRARGDAAEALACFREALRLSPDYRLALVNLSKAQYETGDMASAEASYRQLAKLDPKQFEIWSNLGWVQTVQNRHEQAASSYKRSLSLKPDSSATWCWLANALREQGSMDQCDSAYRRAAQLDNGNLRALLGECLALPPVYRDSAEVSAYRQKFTQGLARLVREKERIKQFPAATLLADLQWSNFFLAYQGLNDCDLQTQHADLVAELLAAAAPEYFLEIDSRQSAADSRIRLGFVSSFLRECTVGSYFKTWITKLDRRRFEIFVYYTGHLQDAVSREIAAAAEHYLPLAGVEVSAIAARIKGDRLDALIYPELGMDATLCMIGAMRLAPLQCVAWGHPVTTGHKNIDYFLSCSAMEPDHAQAHYREKLVLLDGIGTCYPRPAANLKADRRDLGLPVDRHLYLCPQSLHKIHPDNDEVFLDILEQDDRATLVFFQAMFGSVTQAFRERLDRALAARKLDAGDALLFLPRMDHDRYLQVNRCCDLMLDTLHWSGGNTSLDAIACALPLVTLPGDLMRGRQSRAMLAALGLNELIARDKQDYVAIALGLARDAAWRAQIRQRMEQNLDRVFDDASPLRQLEQFLLSQARSGLTH